MIFTETRVFTFDCNLFSEKKRVRKKTKNEEKNQKKG
jgi:hypothetical protein